MLPLRDSRPARIFPFWIIVIIAINVYMFYLELTSPSPDKFITTYALIPSIVDFSNLESLKPFITSQFLHAGFLHIISNMWFLWIFGDNIEERLGFIFFPIFYLGAGAIAALIQYLFTPTSTIPMLGASGAIAGVLGVYFAFFPHNKIDTLIPVFGLPAIIPLPAAIMLFYWFFIQLFNGTVSLGVESASVGGVAYFAHIGGFITGWLMAKLIQPTGDT